jgi:hypothetical protein
MARSPRPVHRPRRSGCIERSQEFERQRIERLSVEERIRLALSLKDRFAGLQHGTRADDGDGTSAKPA